MIVHLWRCLFTYKLTEQKKSQAQTLLISGDFCFIVQYLTGSDCHESYQGPTRLFVIVERFTLRWRKGIFKSVFLIPATLKVMGLIQKHFIRQHLLIQPNRSLFFVSSCSHSPFPLPIKTHTQTHFQSTVSSSNVLSPFVSQFRFRGKHKLIKWVSTLSCPPAAVFSSSSLSLSVPSSAVLPPPPESKSPWQLLACIYLLNHCSGIALDMRGEGERHAS